MTRLGAVPTRVRHIMSAAPGIGPLAAGIERKLSAALQPTELAVINESHLHQGHAGNPGGGPNAETHFRVNIVSDKFEGQRPVHRHRTVYTILAEELQSGVHALALNTKTIAEAAGKQ